MQKLSIITSGLAYFLAATTTFAEGTNPIQLSSPSLGGKPVGYTDISLFINNIIILVFIIAVIIVLFMLIWGALEWILSGGDKDKVGAAQKRITHALIGFAVLAVAFAIARLAGQFLGFDIFGQFSIPSPSSGTGG